MNIPQKSSLRLARTARLLRVGRTVAGRTVAIFVFAMFGIALPALSQPERGPLSIPFPFPGVSHGSFDFGDIEGDGDLDVAMTGATADGPFLDVFHLSDSSWSPDGDTSFRVQVYRRFFMNEHPVSLGTAKLGDYDGDGDADLLVTGLTDYVDQTSRVYEPILEVFENTGRARDPVLGRLISPFVRRHSLPGLYRSAADWGDFDGDGDLDFVVAGVPVLDGEEPVTRLYRNEGGGFAEVATDLPGVMSGDLAWEDYDGDGDPDLALMGAYAPGRFVTHVYRNDAGDLVDSGTEIPSLAYGSLDWGDFDVDGDPDLLVSGGRLDPRFLAGVTKVYRNDAGVLVDGGFDFEGWTLGEARWGDADRDGDLDVFIVGVPDAVGPAALRLFIYDGASFAPNWHYTGMRFSAMDVADYNGDGDADVLVSGRFSIGLQSQFLMNWDYPECVVPSWVPPGSEVGECRLVGERESGGN